ncbi:MAG TPA: hypothetical protein VM537_31160, partial [Anaerolineae bacterium]|nr:hypothetical protein [Anaerolineae bacterium]
LRYDGSHPGECAGLPGAGGARRKFFDLPVGPGAERPSDGPGGRLSALARRLLPGIYAELSECSEPVFAGQIVRLLRDEARRLRYAAEARRTAEHY